MLAGAANAPGLGCTVAARGVSGLCGRCAGAVRAAGVSVCGADVPVAWCRRVPGLPVCAGVVFLPGPVETLDLAYDWARNERAVIVEGEVTKGGPDVHFVSTRLGESFLSMRRSYLTQTAKRKNSQTPS